MNESFRRWLNKFNAKQDGSSRITDFPELGRVVIIMQRQQYANRRVVTYYKLQNFGLGWRNLMAKEIRRNRRDLKKGIANREKKLVGNSGG